MAEDISAMFFRHSFCYGKTKTDVMTFAISGFIDSSASAKVANSVLQSTAPEMVVFQMFLKASPIQFQLWLLRRVQ